MVIRKKQLKKEKITDLDPILNILRVKVQILRLNVDLNIPNIISVDTCIRKNVFSDIHLLIWRIICKDLRKIHYHGYGGHFGRHLELRKMLMDDSSGLLVCFSIHTPRPILKISAFYQKWRFEKKVENRGEITDLDSILNILRVKVQIRLFNVAPNMSNIISVDTLY